MNITLMLDKKGSLFAFTTAEEFEGMQKFYPFACPDDWFMADMEWRKKIGYTFTKPLPAEALLEVDLLRELEEAVRMDSRKHSADCICVRCVVLSRLTALREGSKDKEDPK